MMLVSFAELDGNSTQRVSRAGLKTDPESNRKGRLEL